jgi:hypothetical protein
MKTQLSVGQLRLRDVSGEFDPVRFGHSIEHRDGSAVPEKYALRVDVYGITHDGPPSCW